MQYVYVAGAGTDAAIDLAITKQTRLALYSLIGGFRSKDFGLHTTEAVACDIAKFNGKFIQPVDGNTFADSGGYSFIVGEKSPKDLPVMIDCYTVYLESEGDIFDYIFSLDIPFSLKYKEFNTRKNIFEANEKSLTESQEVLVNCKELQDKFFFVWHFKMKEQFKVWKSLYSSLGMDKVIRNHAVGGMVGLKKAAKISFCPFTGMSFYILNCHLQGPFAGDDFRMHYLGVYSRSDRFHIAFLEKLFNGYLSGVSTVQMSYDSINPIHTVVGSCANILVPGQPLARLHDCWQANHRCANMIVGSLLAVRWLIRHRPTGGCWQEPTKVLWLPFIFLNKVNNSNWMLAWHSRGRGFDSLQLHHEACQGVTEKSVTPFSFG